jgi:hypothetical protein
MRCWLPIYSYSGSGSFPGLSTCGSGGTKWHWDRFIFSVSFHRTSILLYRLLELVQYTPVSDRSSET